MYNIAESFVMYNRSDRQWQVWSQEQEYSEALVIGGVISFPAGKEGKRAAMLAALRNDRSDIADEVEAIIANHPHNEPLIDRAIKAGQLVVAGNVRAPLPLDAPHSYLGECCRVESQTTPGEFYAISECAREMWCTCPDHENGLKRQMLHQDHPERPKYGAPWLGPPIGLACKHIIAWLICCSLSENHPDLEDLEIPF